MVKNAQKLVTPSVFGLEFSRRGPIQQMTAQITYNYYQRILMHETAF